jgi:hypothetical protein
MRLVRIAAVTLIGAAPLLAQPPVSNPSQSDAANVIANKRMEIMRHRAESRLQANTVVSTAEVPPDAPVVTLEGVCSRARATAKSAPCKTVVTRQEMDALVDTLIPSASQSVRSEFAINYARMMAAAEVARRRHLDASAEVTKEIQMREKMARLQVLASALYREFEAKAEKIQPAEIQEYYASHAGDFEEGTVQRLSLPKAAATESGKPLDLMALKAQADSMRARAIAGEDLNQLEQDAYKTLGIKGVVPSTGEIKVRRRSLTLEHGKVFDLKPGEISEVVEAPTALIILKLVSKRTAPLEDVKAEIENTLHQQRIQQNLHTASQSVTAEFNLKYLQTTSSPELFPPPGSGQTAVPSSAAAPVRRMSPRSRAVRVVAR